MNPISGPMSLIGLILLGIAVFWARQLSYHKRGMQYQDSVRLVLGIAAALLVLVGVLGGATHMVFFLSPVFLAVICMLVMRYRMMERRMLLDCISVAAQKGIPIQQAVRGFADERTDELGYRAVILSEGLEAGMDLPSALHYSKTGLPTDAMLAMRLGCETGTLGPAVARVAKSNSDLDLVARTLFEKFLYLGMMMLVMTVCFTFVILKIVPVYVRMFREFELQLPALTRFVIAFSELVANYWFFAAPVVMVLAVMMFVAGMHYVGFLPGDFPGVAWTTRRFDGALVMRSLALAVSYSWPMNRTVWQLARIYPKRGMRGRLASAGRNIDNGEDWCNSLLYTGIINRSDWAVLKSAQRVGNLEWALEEMADSSIRRLIHRWRLVLNVAFPTVLVGVGLGVAFFAIGFFLPLISLIQGLA